MFGLFFLSFSLSTRGGSTVVRYIIEIYAPLSLIAGIGANYLLELVKRTDIGPKLLMGLLVFLYMLVTLIQIKPYYLDYFNVLVGGTNGVYQHKYFELGWWGQGLGEAGYYLEAHAKPNSKIGLFISPPHVFPPIGNQKLIYIDPNKGVYDPKIKYDYIVVNYFHVLREGFDDSGIRRDYKLMHEVKAENATLVYIYEKK